MKKLTFKVSSQKDCSIVSLIKEVNKISCRIYLDLENGFVAIENVNDTMIDTVIELVDNYYTILGVDIDNTFEETSKKQLVPAYTETIEKNVETETVETVVEKQPTVLEPQSEDDLIIKKVEFENEFVENRINGFLKTAYWALYNKCATEKDIGEYILTCMSEISMRYSSKPIIKFSKGDIVDVNYGSHLPGEIMGGHVHAIVCNILNNDMAYVVPITKKTTDITSLSYLIMDAPQDAIYDNKTYRGGTVLIDKGRYIRAERFNSVIGETRPAFFEKILCQLASTFDFTNCNTETAEESIVVPTQPELSAEQSVESSASSIKKIGREEVALLETIGVFLDKLDKSKPVEEQVDGFIAEIGMPTSTQLVTQAFVVACNIKKINYENVILELHNLNPNIVEDIIKESLKENFKNWLEQYPELAEKCPRISLMSVLKVFAKRFA